MKKTVTAVLLLAMLLSLTACDIFGMLGRNEPAFEKAESDVPSDHKISYGGVGNIDDEDVNITFKAVDYDGDAGETGSFTSSKIYIEVDKTEG